MKLPASVVSTAVDVTRTPSAVLPEMTLRAEVAPSSPTK
jgi:hypothetical protein